MKPYSKCSLFLTTYNWPEALELCLKSIMTQTIRPDEVIIADDGSTSVTKELILQYQQKFPVPLIHVWQEDKGFRINAIRNKAIKKASYPYIIQIDGDVILEPHFIEDHLSFSKKGRLLAGRRIRINEANTKQFCERKEYQGLDSKRNRVVAILHHHLLYHSKSIKGVRGCNMSYWKEDAWKVNGYDEAWSGKGPDDKEFAIRMTYSGVKVYNLKFYALQYHLHHGEEGLLNNYKLNQEYFGETVKNRLVQCQKGLKTIDKV